MSSLVRPLPLAPGPTATDCGLASAAASLVGLFCCGSALADEWYAGAARVVPKDEWIVAIDASTTLTTNQSQFTYGAATIAVGGGTLQQSGFRLKLEGLGGNYGYDQSGVPARGEQVEGGVLGGYQAVWNNARIAYYVGLNVRENTVPSANPANSATGTTVGFKTAFDAYLRPTDQSMLSAYASYSTAYDAYYATRFSEWAISAQS
jgi:hypothetical protein